MADNPEQKVDPAWREIAPGQFFALGYDLKDPSDPQGRTYKQVNAEKQHAIRVGALVEIIDDEEGGLGGCRLFVTHHGRDCDMTPLYWLGGADGKDMSGGWGEDSLKVINP